MSKKGIHCRLDCAFPRVGCWLEFVHRLHWLEKLREWRCLIFPRCLLRNWCRTTRIRLHWKYNLGKIELIIFQIRTRSIFFSAASHFIRRSIETLERGLVRMSSNFFILLDFSTSKMYIRLSDNVFDLLQSSIQSLIRSYRHSQLSPTFSGEGPCISSTPWFSPYRLDPRNFWDLV